MRATAVWMGLVAVAGWGLSACDSHNNVNAFNPSPDFVREVTEKARALADRELARMQKAELIYKDSVSTDLNVHHPFNTQLGVVYKKYRHYTGYEVADIRRTESLLAPLRFEIVFDYQLIGTKPRPTDLENAYELARDDTAYSVLRDRRMVRTYDCDMYGNPLVSIPELPPPDSIYELGPGMWEKADPQPPSGAEGARRHTDVLREDARVPDTPLR